MRDTHGCPPKAGAAGTTGQFGACPFTAAAAVARGNRITHTMYPMLLYPCLSAYSTVGAVPVAASLQHGPPDGLQRDTVQLLAARIVNR